MGIGLLISLVVKGIDKLVHANEEAIEKAKELRRKYEEFKSTNESNVTALNGLKKEFEELSKGVSQYGDNISLTTEQYERYKEIIQQIVGMSPSLAEGYSTENGYIADKNGLLERAIELQEIKYRNELRKITNLQNLKTSMAGYIAEYKDAFEGGVATEDMSATSTVKATVFSNALYKAFNYSERYNDGYRSEDLAREILKSLGIDNTDKEMEKFFNVNGCYQPNWFFDKYVDEIAKNINAITNALSYENVGLEEDEFENRILTVKDCAQAYLDMKDSISMANESIQRDLQYIAEYADGYSNLTAEQQKFVNEFLKGFNIDDIVSRDWFGNLTYDEDKMKSVKRQITDFVEALSQDETTQTALADLYAIPTDEQSIGEFIKQFKNALEIIKAYCQKNSIDIPIAITDSEQTINDLESQHQRAVDFAKDKFDGYDPTAFFKERSINTQEEIDKWQAIAQEARDAAEAEAEYLKRPDTEPQSFDISTFKDKLSDINSAVTTLRSALDSFNSGELDKIQVIDLMQQFPELAPYIDLTADGFGNLSEGLSKLISQQPSTLISELEELKDSLTTDEERQQVDLLIDSLQRLTSYGDSGIEAYAATIGNTWNDTANVIEGVVTQFENLAKVQETVADGLTMTTTQAAELAKIYPEILTNAVNAGNGQITLNEEVVRTILDGDKSIVDAQITKLEADKAELEAKKTFAEAQLEVAKSVGEGEGIVAQEAAKNTIEIANRRLKTLIDMGIDEETAYAIAAEAMAGNMQEFNRVTGQVAEDVTRNTADAADVMAQNFNESSKSAQGSINNLQKKLWDFTDAFVNAAQGIVSGSDRIYDDGGSIDKKLLRAETSDNNFNKVQGLIPYNPYGPSLDEIETQLEIDIKNYTDAISNIDAQIEVLKNLQAVFDDHGGIGGHGYADQINKLEKEKQELTDALKDSAEETAKELNWIEKLINRASSALGKLKDKISNTYISWSARNSSLTKAMEKTNEIISIQQQAYERYMKEAESAGLSEEYISRIQNGTLDTEEITDEALSAQISHYTEWYEKALDCADAIEELKTQLSDLAKQRFDSINTYFSSLMATTEKSIGRLETKEKDTSRSPSAKVYRDLRGETQNLISYNIQKAQQLEESLDSAVNSGYIEAGSEAWRDMYNEILDVRNATEEYRLDLQDIAKREYEALLRPFDMELTRLAQRKSVIDSMTERLELQGYVAAKGLYERQLRDSESRLQTLKEQADQLQENFQKALSDGMEIGSDDWIDMKSVIDDNISAVMELENSMIGLNNALRELEWDKFDRFQKSVSRITGESDFMIGMLDKDDKYGEDGTLTDAGSAVIGLHAQNYFAYKEQAEAYKDEIEKINRELADDPTNTTLADRKNDLADAYQNAAKAAYDEYQAVIELAEDGYQKQIESINELIDAKKKQLDADKELYSYQKSIAEKTKNIADLQKQLSALSGDDSEENKAKIQKLNADLADARKDLEETQYDRWHSDQTEMLDRLAEEYAALISEQSQNEQEVFHEMIEYANANAQNIRDTITATAQEWGYSFSYGIDSMLEPVNGMADIGRNIYEEIQRLYELTERMYRVSADLGDLGVTDHGMETTISDESTARNFIERLYNGLLGRKSDEEGMNMWLERLTDGATVQEMLEGFLNSEEYKAMGKSAEDTIHDFYKGLLGRNAEADGFSYWMEQYRRGMSLSDIGTHGFLNSEEFLSRDHWIRLLDAAPATDGYTELAKRGLLPIDSNMLLGAILAPQTSMPEYSGIPNAAGIGNTTFGDINISIPIEHMNDYNDFVTQLQGDGKFEKMIQDMTIGQLAGKSSLAKNSYRW